MHRKKVILTFSLLSLLFGCGTDSTAEPNKQDIPKNVSYNDLDQQPSANAQEILSKYDEITAIEAVNNSKAMMAAVKVKHSERFTLKSFRKKMKKELKEKFPELNIEFSTDLKIFLELEKLEKEMETDTFTADELDKQLDNIIKLSKEQT